MRSERQKIWLSIGSICTFTFLLAIFSTRHLIILNDSRELYVSDHYFGMNALDWKRFFFFPHDYSRLLSAGVGRSIGNMCGPNSPCINLVNGLLLTLTCTAAFFCTMLITRSLKISCLTTFSWVISAATLNSVLWQATQHDKLAALWFFITVSISILIFRSPLISISNQLLSGITLTLFIVVAFNTKETTFILPAILVIVAFASQLGDKRSLRQLSTILGIPLAYSAWYLGYFFTHIAPGIAAHSFDGDIVNTSLSFLRQFLNLGNLMYLTEYSVANMRIIKLGSSLYVLGFLIFVIFFLRLTFRKDFWSLDDQEKILSRARVLIPFCTLIACLGGILRTKVPTVFYLLIPTWAFLLLFWHFSLHILESGLRGKIFFRLCLVMICTAYLSTFSIHFGQNGVVSRLNSSSHELQKTLTAIKNDYSARQTTIVLEDQNSYGVWYFLYGSTPNLDPWLNNYIFKKDPQKYKISLVAGTNDCTFIKTGACVVLNSKYEVVKSQI